MLRGDPRRAAGVRAAEQPAVLEYVIAGETNLMGAAHLTDVDKLKRLFEAFNEKRDFLHLLDQSLHAEGVQIFIGHESGYQVLDDCSIVTAPYSDDNGVVGVIGVIGPTRMAYERVIPIVDVTARLARLGLEFPPLDPNLADHRFSWESPGVHPGSRLSII